MRLDHLLSKESFVPYFLSIGYSVLKGYCEGLLYKGGVAMLETKVILMSLAHNVVLSDNTRQVYSIIRSMAQVEGLSIPDYDELKAEMKDKKDEN